MEDDGTWEDLEWDRLAEEADLLLFTERGRLSSERPPGRPQE